MTKQKQNAEAGPEAVEPGGEEAGHAADPQEVQNPEIEDSDPVKNGNDTVDVAREAADELTAQAAELESLRQELQSTQEQLLRKAAEFQNYRRRTEQEKAGLVEYGKAQVVQQLLDVVDDFQRSIEAAERSEEEGGSGAAYASLKEGVDLVYRKLMGELQRLGVEPIEAVGVPFDEQEHEALMQQPAPDGTEPGIVLQELQRGYRMGDRVLRHSKVVVSA